MKKTIKYGGLVAGVATAAAAMGATPVFAATTPDVFSDCSLKASATTGLTVDESDYDSVAAYKNAEAQDYAKIADCYTGLATTAAGTMATKAGLISSISFVASGANEASVTNARDLAQVIVSKFGEVSEENLIAKFKTDGSWAKAEEANPTLNETGILAVLAVAGDDTYGQKATYAAYTDASNAADLIKTANEWLKATAEADKATAKETELKAEATAATKVKAAQVATEALDEKVEEAEEAIAKLDSNDALKAELEAALEATLNGDEDAASKAALASEKADAKDTEATNTKATAEAAVNGAKTAAGVDAPTFNAASAAADAIVKAFLASDEAKKLGVTSLDDEALIEALKSEATDSLWATSADELGNQPTSVDILSDIIGDAAHYEDEKGFEGVKALAAAYKAQALIDAVNAYDEVATAADKAAAAKKAADIIKTDLSGLVTAADGAIEDAEEAIEKVEDDAVAKELTEALDEATTPSDDDNKGDDNKGDEDNTKTYTYETISDSETVYVAGNNLVLHFDAPFADFDYLTIDGVTIDSAMYTAADGSTKITLSSKLLDTLKSGEHTVVAYYKDGKTATAKFTIASAEVKTPNTGAYTAEAASATLSVSAVVGAIMAATLAGAVVVIRRRA